MIESLVFALVLNLLLFILAYSFRTDKLTDAAYALTFVGITVLGVVRNDMSNTKWLVSLVVLVWAARLGTYLVARINRTGQDKRFDQLRDSFFKFGLFWLSQALVAWVIMLPTTLLLAVPRVTTIDTIVIVGIAVALLGIGLETIADRQKQKFQNDPLNKGKWIESGLWRYSRHPNYFGEILVWYGLYTASYSWLSSEQIWWAVLSPITITMLLVAVTGIPPLERSADKKWGKNPRYRAYKREVSMLVPMPRKKSNS